MPIARVQLPDGRIGRFEVPEGTTPEQAQSLIQAQLPALSQPAAPQLPESLRPRTAAPEGIPGARFIPGTDAAGFMARFDQIKGSSFLEAFESLKGGGAITEKEGQKGTDAINRMSTATDEKEFIRAALDLQDVIRKGVENAQKRAARAGGAAPAAPAAPAAGGVKFLGFE